MSPIDCYPFNRLQSSNTFAVGLIPVVIALRILITIRLQHQGHTHVAIVSLQQLIGQQMLIRDYVEEDVLSGRLKSRAVKRTELSCSLPSWLHCLPDWEGS